MTLLNTLKAWIFGRQSEPKRLESPRTDTEFTAEVVRITQLLTHPNADKLEIARFSLKDIGETTYEVVVRKGEYQVEELVGYFSVDCLLPTSHPDFAFLKERLDGKDKAVFRLRAARLRKVFSQGLITKLPEKHGLCYGQQLADLYGVTYHRDPEPAERGPTAPSKPKPQVAPIYGVESLKKVPNLFAANEPVFTTEKIHGTNFRFGWVRRRILGGLIPWGWRFYVGSHRTERTPGKSSWYGEDLYALAAENMGLRNLTRNHKGYVFYGELYGYTYDAKAIQPDWTYGRSPNDGPGLVIFDVKDLTEGCWLSAWEREDVVDTLGLKGPPILQAYDTINVCAWEGQKSVLDPDTIMEGIVVENLSGLRRKAKYVHQAYLEAK
jgi:RNA ligase (TIGR02306 family)